GVFDLLKFMVDIKPIQLINEIPDNLPPVYADKNRVIQIVYNLMHNAIKFTDEGTVIISAHVKNRQVFISIRDTGRGIDQAHLEQIFLPYEQADNMANTDGGYGLGLGISKQLIELHGSTLNVTSRLGKGSTFTFSLVMATTEQIQSFEEKFVKSAQTVMLKSNDKVDLESNFFAMSEQQIAASSEQHTFVNGQSKKFHLLVVDDDPI